MSVPLPDPLPEPIPPVVVDCAGLCRSYASGASDVAALRDVDLVLRAGESVAITGASGSGKSTLLNLLGGLDRPSAGRVRVAGEDLDALPEPALAALRNRAIGFVFQQFNLLARASVLHNVVLPMTYAGVARGEREARARELLARVGLAGLEHRLPSQLSGGQQQRVAIARALANRPPLLLADEPTGALDSATGASIVELLLGLSRDGDTTVVLVTHDPRVAAACDRMVGFSDGRIVEDRITGHPRTRASRGPAAPAGGPARAASLASRLRTLDLLSEAARGIVANRLRSSLTALGVVIGVASVVMMLGIGQGSRERIAASIASLGTRQLIVMSGSPNSGGLRGPSGGLPTLRVSDADAMTALIGVARAAPVANATAQVVAAGANASTSLVGTTPSYFDIHTLALTDGDRFGDGDVRTAANVAVLGPTVKRALFGDADAIGRTIRIQRQTFRVIGVLAPRGQGFGGQDQDDLIIAPVSTVQRKLAGTPFPGSVGMIVVEARWPDHKADAQVELAALLCERHGLRRGADDDFTIRDLSSIGNTLKATSTILSALLGSIAFISLGVGGIGIMNIMLVSVTERTREIGLRLALGATRARIRDQFLAEAVALSVAGGLVGLALSTLAAWAITRLGLTVRTDASVVALALGVTLTVGIVFGWWPARRAAALRPVEALRQP